MIPGWIFAALRFVPVVKKLVPVAREIGEAVKPPPTVAESNAKGEAAAESTRAGFEELRKKK